MPASLDNAFTTPIIPLPHMHNLASSASSDAVSTESDIGAQKFILAKTWFARAFQKITKPADFFTDTEQHAEILREYFGLEFNTKSPSKTLEALNQQNATNEEEYLQLIKRQPAFIENLAYLHDQLGLSDAEQRVLLFLCILHDETDLEAIERCRIPTNQRKLNDLLGFVLGCKGTDINKALAPDGLLRRSGLVSRANPMFGGTLDSFQVPYATRQALFCDSPILEDLSAPLLKVAPPAKLTPAHFVGLEQHTQLASFYLEQTLNSHKNGSNLLLYGAPGTGKTEYARVLATTVNATLIEVPSQTASYEALKGEQRITLARQAGRMYRKTARVLLFDEAEDVFASPGFGRSAASRHKAWINDLLETSELPTIWISNDISDMDAAFLRRFDIIINIDNLSNDDRQQQFANALTEQVRDEVLASIARHRPITTAMVERGSQMAKLQVLACEKTFEQALIDSLNSCLSAQSFRELPPIESKQVHFNTAFVQCSANLSHIIDGLRAHKSGRLCMYGPPGTGKSAFARWVGDQLSMPVLVKRGSDLTGKYVGENEKRIANAFAQATREQAILIIDEIDSFLADRTSHNASWETRSVNELLTQMETFEGIFIASTNLMDTLDEAAMRRFDMKLHFDYLDSEQRELMLIQTCESLGLGTATADDIETVRRLDFLTPGDFSLIARRQRLIKLACPSALIAQLDEETRFKREAKQRIGF